MRNIIRDCRDLLNLIYKVELEKKLVLSVCTFASSLRVNVKITDHN